VYIVAPIVGGLIAAGVYTAVRFTQDAPAPSEEVTSMAGRPA
jgi:phosphate/sulfate permease